MLHSYYNCHLRGRLRCNNYRQVKRRVLTGLKWIIIILVALTWVLLTGDKHEH